MNRVKPGTGRPLDYKFLLGKGDVRGNRGIWLDVTGAFRKWKMSARKLLLNITSGWGEKIIILQYIQAIVIVKLIDRKQNGGNRLFV